jgi:hypothetical protein
MRIVTVWNQRYGYVFAVENGLQRSPERVVSLEVTGYVTDLEQSPVTQLGGYGLERAYVATQRAFTDEIT